MADIPVKSGIIGHLIDRGRKRPSSTPMGKGNAIRVSVRKREDPAWPQEMRAAAAYLPPMESVEVGTVRH